MAPSDPASSDSLAPATCLFSIKDAIDLLEAKISRANGHWTFLFAIDAAVLGWLVSLDKPIVSSVAAGAAILLLLAYAFILLALLRAQREMNLLNEEIKACLPHESPKSSYAYFLKKRSFVRFPVMTIIVNVVAAGFVLALIWFLPS